LKAYIARMARPSWIHDTGPWRTRRPALRHAEHGRDRHTAISPRTPQAAEYVATTPRRHASKGRGNEERRALLCRHQARRGWDDPAKYLQLRLEAEAGACGDLSRCRCKDDGDEERRSCDRQPSTTAMHRGWRQLVACFRYRRGRPVRKKSRTNVVIMIGRQRSRQVGIAASAVCRRAGVSDGEIEQ